MLIQTFHSDASTFVVDRADRCGLLFSSLCVLHCLVLPTVISLTPVFYPDGIVDNSRIADSGILIE